MHKRSAVLVLLIMCVGVVLSAKADETEPRTARDIVKYCEYKNPGNDQRSHLTIILTDKDGSEKKNVYRRLWKNYKGNDGIDTKMMLFTEFPPDAEGVGFMRWAYTSNADKNADQWIYLPTLKKIRRVSVRDPGDSFLGSDLTYFDISGRSIDADDYKITKTERSGNNDVIVIESTPHEDSSSLYSRVVSYYVKGVGSSWDTCVKRQAEYYDKKGEPLKQQVITWQQVKDAWVWDEMKVHNLQTDHSSTFQITDVQINVGLDNDMFSERNLQRPPH
jgi:Outer membrane lipoprotein-sorting protein